MIRLITANRASRLTKRGLQGALSLVIAASPLALTGVLGQVTTPPTTTAPSGSNLDVAVEEALDEKTDLDVRDQNILAAFDDLTRQTGVRVLVDEGTLDRLPYGEQTKLTARIKGATLREGLKALLHPIGLVFEVRSGAVYVAASPPLQRIVGRASWDDLDLLRRLNETPWSDQLWNDLPVQFRDAGSDEKISKETLGKLARGIGAGSAAEVLEHACGQQGWTWYPAGKKTVVLSRASQIKRQLDRRVSLRFFRTPLSDVLLDLGREANVLIKIEPGVIASLPAQIAQSFSLMVENTSVRQGLEVIAGTTGLGFIIESDGIRITANPLASESTGAPGQVPAGTPSPAQTNPAVGMVTMRGENGAPDISFFVRESDIGPDLMAARKRKIEEAVNAIRKALKADKVAGAK
jgi:hypothetical protein